MKEIRTILLTTDFSDTSAEAFAPAAMLAARFGAKLRVLHVEDDRIPPLVVEYAAVGLEEIRQKHQATCRSSLDAFTRQHLPEGLEVEAEVCLGVPHVEIVRDAEEHDVDLIVMATHGRGFFSHMILGSTTERVLRRAPCPVLVAREGQGDA